MQVYIKHYGKDRKTSWDKVRISSVSYIPFTKDTRLSYEIGDFRQDEVKIYVGGETFAAIKSDYAEEFVNYFLGQAHRALSISDGAFIVYDGKKLVDTFLRRRNCYE